MNIYEQTNPNATIYKNAENSELLSTETHGTNERDVTQLKKEVANQLKEIAKYCSDSIDGYKAASESIAEDHPAIALQWKENAASRTDFLGALDQRLLSIGEDEVDSHSFAGTIHRGFLKLKGIFSSDEFEAELTECIRGEEKFQSTIEETLEETTLDGATRSLLQNLNVDVKTNLANLRQLKR